MADDRTAILLCDATQQNFLDLIKDVKFDIIIDDGSHQLDHQIKSFDLLKNSLNEKALYIIEDVWGDHVTPINEKFKGVFSVMDLRHERVTQDNILMIYEKK